MPASPRGYQAEGEESVGRSEQEDRQEQTISQVDAAYTYALNRIADAIELLARATAGEFDQEDDDLPPTDISGRPI